MQPAGPALECTGTRAHPFTILGNGATHMVTFVSFIIPAHNEAEHIEATVSAIAEAARSLPPGVGHEIVVACDACTDQTPRIARGLGARAVEFEKRQISASRNQGALSAAAAAKVPATNHMYLFVDADTRVSPASVREAVDALGAGCVGGGAPVEFDGDVPRWVPVVLPIVTALFRFFRLTGGAFLFARRDHFEAVGGWDESVFASEEIILAKALKRRGEFRIVRTPVLTSGRKLRTFTGREMLALVGKHVITGGRMLRRREGLEMWYGPRREDPYLISQVSGAKNAPPS